MSEKQAEEEKQEEETPQADPEKLVDSVEEEETTDDDDTKNKDDKRLHMKVAADAPWKDRMWEVFTTFWPLGLVRTVHFAPASCVCVCVCRE